MNKTNKRDWMLAIAFVVLAAVLIHCASIIMRPVHNSYGSTWDAYLCEPEDSIDVLFLGSSYAYCDWNPEIMYAASGLTGYVMAGSEQTPSITYWYLKQALKTQSPQVVVMEGSSFFFEMYQNYTQINLDYMPRGIDRARAILDAAEPDKRLGLFFDLYFYHDRWKELTREDIAKLITPAIHMSITSMTRREARPIIASRPRIRQLMKSTSKRSRKSPSYAGTTA